MKIAALDKIVAAVCKKMLPLTERSTRGAGGGEMDESFSLWKARAVDSPAPAAQVIVGGQAPKVASSELKKNESVTCRQKSNTFPENGQVLLTAQPFFGKLEAPNSKRSSRGLTHAPHGEKIGSFCFCQKNILNWISSYRRRRRSGIREDRRLFRGRGVCASAFFCALKTLNSKGGIMPKSTTSTLMPEQATQQLFDAMDSLRVLAMLVADADPSTLGKDEVPAGLSHLMASLADDIGASLAETKDAVPNLIATLEDA